MGEAPNATTGAWDRTPEGREARKLSRLTEDCRHFNGVQHDTCAAGVPYLSVTVYDADQKAHARPCIAHYAGCAAGLCAKFATLSPDEAAAQYEADERRLTAFISGMGKARALIVAATGNKGGAGTVPCPTCGGALRYAQAASNKHVRAQCSTAGCLGWIE